MKALFPLFLSCLAAVAALAGPNAGGTIVAHDPQVTWTVDQTSYCGLGIAPTSCSTVDARLDGTGVNDIAVWKVYALFSDQSSPRLSALSFGIHYPEQTVILSAYGSCRGAGGEEFQGANWPHSDTGTTVAFGSAQTGRTVECYWFAGYAYSPALFQLRDHPDPHIGGTFADDEVPSVLDPIAGYGSLGFDTPGTVACPSSTGACCDLKQGTCTVISYPECVALGHDFDFEGLPSCDPNPCLQRGPCCVPLYGVVICVVTTPDSCLNVLGGQFPGHCGQNCPGDPPCEWHIGACCIDSLCTVTSQSECGPGGIWISGVSCVPSPCGQIGACCDGQACHITFAWDCNGDFFLSRPCDPDPCSGLPQGACCARDGTCTVTLEGACHPPDQWLGPGTVCDPNPCLGLPGACCHPDGTCTVTTIDQCQAPDRWEGYGTDCVPNPCGPPTGACCNLETGECHVMPRLRCESEPYPHEYLGDGTTCDPNPCPAPVPVQLSTWGRIKAGYR